MSTEKDLSEQGTKETIAGYLDSLTSGDLDRIRSFFAVDATWRIHGTLPLAGTYSGADAIMGFLTSAMGGLFLPGTQQFEFGQTLVAGNTAIVEWNVTGVGAATNRAYDNDYCGLFVIEDKRIRQVREYFDSDHVREVLYGPRGAN